VGNHIATLRGGREIVMVSLFLKEIKEL